MSTGDEFANITPKKLLGYGDLGTRILDYLKNAIHESLGQIWSSPAVHDTALVLESDGANAFKITGTSESSDGQGRLLKINEATINDGISFENSNGVVYQIALKYTEIPSEIDINPRTGLPEYRKWIEEIGEKDIPDDVTDNGNGTITFQVDSVTESGVSNAGRQVMVYKLVADKNATTVSVAIETCIVVWSGGMNNITTSGTLGQNNVSTTESDYNVILLGPTVKRYVDMKSTSGYVYIGEITGNAGTPSVFDTSEQVIAINDLSNLNEQLTTINDEITDIEYDLSPVDDITGDLFVTKVFPPAKCLNLPNGPSCSMSPTGETSRSFKEICYANIGGKKKILAASANYDYQLYVFDVETHSLDNHYSLTANLPASSYWWAHSICADDQYCYVLLYESTYGYYLQSYSLADFSVNINWPTLGLSCGGAGAGTAAAKVQIANDTKLVVLQRWNVITADTDPLFRIVNKEDGTSDGVGAGGVTLTSSTTAYGLASNGTFVYSIVVGATQLEIISMPIASPGGTGGYWPFSMDGSGAADTSKYKGALCVAGTALVMGTDYEAGYPCIKAFELSTTTYHISAEGLGYYLPDTVCDIKAITFDGMNFWGIGNYGYGDYSFNDCQRAFKIPINKTSLDATYLDPEGNTPIPERFRMSPYTGTGSQSFADHIPVCHDGRDMWVVEDPTMAAGIIIRFAKTLMR